MITLSMPSDQHNLYCNAFGFLVGPFGLPGSPPVDTFSYRHSLDVLTQGENLFHENDVDHLKYTGNITVFPASTAMTASPTATFPYRVNFTAFNKERGVTRTEVIDHGLATTSQLQRIDDGRFITHRSITSASNTHVEFYEVMCERRYPNESPQLRHFRVDVIPSIRGKVDIVRQERYAYNKLVKNTEWTGFRSFNEVVSLVGPAMTYVALSSVTLVAEVYRFITPVGFSPSKMKLAIDSYITANLDLEDFSIPLEHFGTLASKAAEGVNRNNVNMIAFLKDLRRPKDLIPKLRNLKKVKTHAGNYLAVNYGVLPTISDIQNIVAAFEKIKPYIDKNGFDTYNAVHNKSNTRGVFTEVLEQRIKIAIEHEDSEFISAMNRIHSAGFAPTLENMWDLVPYSFVLDWFIDIGSLLERVDSTLSLLRLNIRYATLSHKRTLSSTITITPENPMFGTISAVTYRRWTVDHSPLPPLSLSSEITAQNHWLEAGALIIQRTK